MEVLSADLSNQEEASLSDVSFARDSSASPPPPEDGTSEATNISANNNKAKSLSDEHTPAGGASGANVDSPDADVATATKPTTKSSHKKKCRHIIKRSSTLSVPKRVFVSGQNVVILDNPVAQCRPPECPQSTATYFEFEPLVSHARIEIKNLRKVR